MTVPRESLPRMDALALEMRDAALDLACLVREGDRDEIADRLNSLHLEDPRRAWAFAVMCASMIDTDAGTTDLLAWMDWVDWTQPVDTGRRPGRPPAPCGTYSAYLRHCAENRARRTNGLPEIPIHDICQAAEVRFRVEHPRRRVAPAAA